MSGVLNGGVPPEASGNSRETPVTPKIGGMAFGYYPTISDIVRIARLYQAFGAHQGQQLLYAPKIKEIFARTSMPGLPTGEATPYGEVFYFNTFWKAPYSTPQGCKLLLSPNGATAEISRYFIALKLEPFLEP